MTRAWVRESWSNVRRRYHTDKDCAALQSADGEPREATESEVDTYDLCKWCAGEVEMAHYGSNLATKLRDMDPDDVTAGGRP